MFKAGWDVMWVQYMPIFQSVVYAFGVNPIILCKYVPDYTWKEILLSTWQMIKVAIPTVAISITLSLYFRPESIGLMLIDGLVIMLSVCLSSYAFMDRTMGTKLMTLVKN